MDQQRPVRRMSDMGPRRMDGFGRSGSQSQPQPQQRPVSSVQPRMAPQPQSRPVQRPMPQRVAQQRPVGPMPQQANIQRRQVRDERSAPEQTTKRAGWQVAVQFVIGLLVIVAVAAAIVWLYMRYYQ